MYRQLEDKSFSTLGDLTKTSLSDRCVLYHMVLGFWYNEYIEILWCSMGYVLAEFMRAEQTFSSESMMRLF